MSDGGQYPIEVVRLFAAASPGVLVRLHEFDHRVPRWGSLLALPRTDPNTHFVHLVGDRPDEEERIAANVRRARFLANSILRVAKHTDRHESPELDAANVGSVLTPQHVLTFHSPRTLDEISHTVASWLALEGGMLTQEDVAKLAYGTKNSVLISALSAFPLACVA